MKIDLTEDELSIIYNCIEWTSNKNAYMEHPKFTARNKIWDTLEEIRKRPKEPCFFCRKWFS